MDSWRVIWTDATGIEHSRDFPVFLDSWIFNEEMLKGRGEVILLTDRPLSTQAHSRTEADAARRREGGGRRSARKPKREGQ